MYHSVWHAGSFGGYLETVYGNMRFLGALVDFLGAFGKYHFGVKAWLLYYGAKVIFAEGGMK
jgi:hypothetical protein